MSNLQTKFGWISSNGLEGDIITDRRVGGQTDGGDYTIPFAFVKNRGDKHVGSSTIGTLGTGFNVSTDQISRGISSEWYAVFISYNSIVQIIYMSKNAHKCKHW